MNKIKQILRNIKFWLHEHGDLMLATLGGVALGLVAAVVMHDAQLQGYLRDRVMEWRSAALQSQPMTPPAIAPAPQPLHAAAPVFFVAEDSQASSSSIEESSSSVSSMSLPEQSSAASVQSSSQQRLLPASPPVQFSSASSVVSSPATSSSSLSSSVEILPQSPTPAAPVAPSASTAFPAFGKTLYPVSKVPNWGAMHTPAEWNRTYAQMTAGDFVPVPAYDLSKLSISFQSLVDSANVQEVTRKLFYSTKYMGTYDLDAAEFSGNHPGVDLKLPIGTPVGAIAGGRVQTVENGGPLGLHVIIEHHLGNDVFYSIYGHFSVAAVHAGQDVTPGQFIGTVGITGNTSGPHLHLQVDRGHGEAVHEPYAPAGPMSAAQADIWMANPMRFIAEHASGN